MNIKLLIKQFTFPLSLILLCYINLQYMHYSILIDKYSLTPFSYLENIIHAFIDICLLFFIPLYLIGKKTYLFFIPYTIITILVIVNVSYSRFFYTYMPPILYGASITDWTYRALTLLVISCPCALVISTPVSIVSAITKGTKIL